MKNDDNVKTEYMLTKKQSAALHGIAILFMIYHHLFSMAFNYTNISFFNIDIVMKAAWFCKICVGIYAFTGGYGMYHVLRRKTVDTALKGFGQHFLLVLKQLLKLYLKVWLVLALFLGIDRLFIHTPFDYSFMSILSNATAFNPTYAATGVWWYVREYAIMLISLPFFELYINIFKTMKNKASKLVYICCSLIVGAVVGFIMIKYFRDVISFLQPAFILTFYVGYIFASGAVYKRLTSLLKVRAGLSVVLAIVSLLAAIGLRVLLASDASWAKLDFAIVPLFVYGFVGCISLVKPLLAAFSFLGNFSTFMWLCHGFVYMYFLNALCEIVNSSFLLYFIMLLITFAVSLVFVGIEKTGNAIINGIGFKANKNS